jgi:hypothetical protein
METRKPQEPDSGDAVQGEGDYASARRYRKDVEHFVQTADIDKAAHDAAPRDAAEAQELEDAEESGKRRAKVPRRKSGPQDDQEIL